GGGGQSVVDEGVEAARRFRRQVGGDVEITHLAGEAGGKRGSIEAGDRTDAGLSREDVRPGLRDVVADRADDPEPGDDDSTTCHVECGPEGLRPSSEP